MLIPNEIERSSKLYNRGKLTNFLTNTHTCAIDIQHLHAHHSGELDDYYEPIT